MCQFCNLVKSKYVKSKDVSEQEIDFYDGNVSLCIVGERARDKFYLNLFVEGRTEQECIDESVEISYCPICGKGLRNEL